MDKQLEELFDMIQNLILKVKDTPGVAREDITKIQSIIDDYKQRSDGTNVQTITKMREEMYELYKKHDELVKRTEKYTPKWENERRLRDMYFKFLNIPILFLIGMRDTAFSQDATE